LESVYGVGNPKVNLLVDMGEETQRNVLKQELEEQEALSTLSAIDYTYEVIGNYKTYLNHYKIQHVFRPNRDGGTKEVVYIRGNWNPIEFNVAQGWAKEFAKLFPSDTVYSVVLTHGPNDERVRGGSAIPEQTYAEIRGVSQ
jgi:hypothetical protein